MVVPVRFRVGQASRCQQRTAAAGPVERVVGSVGGEQGINVVPEIRISTHACSKYSERLDGLEMARAAAKIDSSLIADLGKQRLFAAHPFHAKSSVAKHHEFCPEIATKQHSRGILRLGQSRIQARRACLPSAIWSRVDPSGRSSVRPIGSAEAFPGRKGLESQVGERRQHSLPPRLRFALALRRFLGRRGRNLRLLYGEGTLIGYLPREDDAPPPHSTAAARESRPQSGRPSRRPHGLVRGRSCWHPTAAWQRPLLTPAAAEGGSASRRPWRLLREKRGFGVRFRPDGRNSTKEP